MSYRSQTRSRPNPAPVLPGFLSEDDCRALVGEIAALSTHRGKTTIELDSHWSSSVRWARNHTSVVSDERDTTLSLERGLGKAHLNQTDSTSLATAVHWAEKMARLERRDPAIQEIQEFVYAPPDVTYPKTYIWSEPTYRMTSDERGAVANALMASAEKAGMLSAGYLNVRAGSQHLRLPDERMLYARYTVVECSLTVRDPNGKGSGWAGASSYDWKKIDAGKLAEIALDKCLRSRNPVRIEPGRYTVIMEPQATYDFMRLIMGGVGMSQSGVSRGPSAYMEWEWEEPELPGLSVQRPFHEGTKRVPTSAWGSANIGVTKVGQRLLGTNIVVSFDPEDPQLGGIPFTVSGDPYVPVTWWDNGVLKTLAYGRGRGPNHAKLDAQPNAGIFRMSGGTSTIDEMIATTERGLMVTRFWGIKILDPYSMLCSGATCDGLWLIERGKISRPVTNLRFTESPLFVFNNVEQLGVPAPVFAPGLPALVPPAKVRDFSFTSMADAI